jgi:hypothetical protein
MSYVRENLRLFELVAIVRQNKPFFDDFLEYLREQGYPDVHSFIREAEDTRATAVMEGYLKRDSGAVLYDGLLRPYPNAQARWYFIAWLLRDAPAQRLGPMVSSGSEGSVIGRRAALLNDVRRYVEPLFPDSQSWEWSAIAEVMLARLEGSRRALKGTLFEEIVRRNLRELFKQAEAPLTVSDKEIRLHDETYDVQVSGPKGTILLPVKTRETMGGGHALLFTRDIYKSISVAEEHGFVCIPIVIAESWGGNLKALTCENSVYVAANPNQISSPLALNAIANWEHLGF